MRRSALLQVLVEAVGRLAGSGALHNAAAEVERAERSAVDLDVQLGRLLELPPRRAA